MTSLLLTAALLTTTAAPQQATPPPTPAANDASLEATMHSIEDGILGQKTHAGEYRAVRADAGSCTLSWTSVETYMEKPLLTQTTEQKVFLNDLANVSVAYDELAAGWNLELYAAPGKKVSVYSYFLKKDAYPCEHCKKKSEARSERSRWFIYFPTEEMADREAKEILHAAELCRGGGKSPL